MESNNVFWNEFNKQVVIISIQLGITEEEAKLKLLSVMEEKLKDENIKQNIK